MNSSTSLARSCRFALMLVMSALSGCRCGQGSNQTALYGQLRVLSLQNGIEIGDDDGTIDFGAVAMGSKSTLKVTIQNVGRGVLNLDSLEKVSGDAVSLGTNVVEANPVFNLKFAPVRVASGETQTFELEFSPPEKVMSMQVAHQATVSLKASNTGPAARNSAQLTFTGIGVSGQCDVARVVDFGSVARGDVATKQIVIRNPQSTDATAFVCGKPTEPRDCRTPESVTGDAAFLLTADSPRENFTVAAGKSRTVSLAFTPAESRAYSAVLTVRVSSGCPDIKVRLLGTGVAQVLDWTCDPHLQGNLAACDFGYVPPQQISSARVTFSNRSLRDVTLSGVHVEDTAGPSAVYSANAASLIVPAGARDAISAEITPGTSIATIVFKPTALGERPAFLKAASDLPKQAAVAVTLRGFGGGPNIVVRPSPLAFGHIAYFANAAPASNATRRLTVVNAGTRPQMPDPRANLRLGPGGMPASSGPKYWKVVAKNEHTSVSEICVGAMYALVGGECLDDLPGTGQGGYEPAIGLDASRASAVLDIAIRVTPHTTDAKAWELTIFSNDPDEPALVVPITAEPVISPTCMVQVTPANLSFGVVTPPNEKDLGFTIKNLSSSSTCLLTNLDLAAGSHAMFSLPAGVVNERRLAPNETFAVVVRSTPEGVLPPTPATVTGQVSFNVASPTAPQQQVTLTATLAPSCLVIAPRELDFGTVQTGCTSPARAFQVYSTCIAPITIQGSSMVAPAGVPAGAPGCPGPAPCPEFIAVNTGALTGTLGQGDLPKTFQLRYAPLDVGADTGAFLVKAVQSGQPIDYVVTLKGVGDSAGVNVDSFEQSLRPKADILLVIDDSCSMADKQRALGDNLNAFISYATTHRVDFRIAAVTTDFTSTFDGYFRSGPPGIGDSTSPKVNRVITPTTTNLASEFASFVKAGIGGSGTESCMEPATRALTAPLVNDIAANGGFLRDDAVLAVVCMTDAIDNAPHAPLYYLNQLLNIKGAQKRGLFSYNVIGPFLPSAPAGECSYDDSAATGDDGTHSFMVASTGGIKEEICSTDWGRALQNVGKKAFGYRTDFFLTSTPDLTAAPPAITVNIDGVSVPQVDGSNGAAVWSYDAMANAVKFEPLYLPEPGRTMKVTYRVVCSP